MSSWIRTVGWSAPTPDELGRTDYAFATQKCVEQGGWLPTAAQLLGAAARVKLASTIDDSPLTAAIDEEPGDGLKDKPDTLQYVTVYDNHEHGGFAGSKPVGQPESFRCAFAKVDGAAKTQIG